MSVKGFVYPAWARMTRINRTARRNKSDRGALIQGGAVVCAALGIDTDLTLIHQLFALLLCLIVVSRIALRFNRPNISVSRVLPRYATAGQPFTYHLQVRNLGDSVERDLYFDDNLKVRTPTLDEFSAAREPGEETRNLWDRSIGFHRFIWLQKRMTGLRTDRGHLPEVAVRATANVEIEATPLRRGIVNFESVTTLHPDPLGLHYGLTRTAVTAQLTVVPRRYPVDGILEAAGGRHFQSGGVTATWSTGESDEFVSLREYREGDSMRKIHWASSARRNKLLVKEFQDEYFSRQLLALDSCTTSTGILEEAISLTASFCTVRQPPEGLSDLLILDDGPQLISAGRGLHDSTRQLEALAVLETTTSPFADLAAAILAHQNRVSMVLIVFCSWDAERAALLQRITGRGLTAFLIADDDGVELPACVTRLPPDAVESTLAQLSGGTR